MTLSPHPASTLAALARLAGAWLALILLVQGVAAASALGAGAMHRHRDGAFASGQAHHHHETAERHHHRVSDSSVVVAGQEVPDPGLAQTALAWAFSLLAVAITWQGRCRLDSAMPSATPWVASMTFLAPPRRPPRG